MLKFVLRVGGRVAGIVALAMILAVIARAQGDSLEPERYEKSKQPVYLAPQPDHALLYVARLEYVRVFGLADFKVFVDDKAAGWLPQRSYLAVQVEPGRRLLWGPSQNEAVRFNFEAGKTYLLLLNETYISMGNGSTLDRTWWSERGPDDIKVLVPAGKLEYVTTFEEPLAELSKEAAKKFAKTNEKARDTTKPSLPASFEDVWYRQEKRKLLLKGFEAKGTLTISPETIEYKGDKKTLVIPMKNVRRIVQGTFMTVGDDAPWDIVVFTTDVSEEVAAFRDGRSFGPGGATGLIYRTLLAAAQQNAPSGPSGPSEAHIPVVAGYSEKPLPEAEGQPASPPAAQPATASESQLTVPMASEPDAGQSAPASPPPVYQQGTLGSPLLQQDTLRNIELVDGANAPDCETRRRVLKMEITKQPVGVRIKHNRAVSGWWEERWTIDRCGKQVAYYITYRNDSRGEVDFNVAHRDDGRGGTDTASRTADVPKQEQAQEKDQEKKADAAAPLPTAAAAASSVPAALQSQPAAAVATPAPAATSSQPASAATLPDGFVLFEGRKDQFIIAIPKDWAVHDQARLLEEHGVQRMKDNYFNMIIFYRSPDAAPSGDMSVEVMRKIDTLEVPSFFVQKVRPSNGMSCGEFSEKAQKEVLKLVSSSDSFTKGATVTEAPHAEPSAVAGCKGTRIQGSGQAQKSSTATKHVVYAASDGAVLYLFSLRGPADKFDQSAQVFEKAMATARLTAAR